MEPFGQPKLRETRYFGIGRLRFEVNDPEMTFGPIAIGKRKYTKVFWKIDCI